MQQGSPGNLTANQYLFQGRALWKALHTRFESPSLSNKSELHTQLKTMRMARGDDVSVFLMEMDRVRNVLANMGEPITDASFIGNLLDALPDTYDHIKNNVVANDTDLETTKKQLISFHNNRLTSSSLANNFSSVPSQAAFQVRTQAVAIVTEHSHAGH